jgi:tetratricopeptide (TPR) repeat protein
MRRCALENRCWAIGVCVVLWAPGALADDTQEAQAHFQRAKELYQQGNYGQARKELEAAHDLDPAAKDLVFNLGIVCEKLDRIDDAIRYFKMYLNMDIEANERARAEATIKRLEGVKRTRPKEPPAPAPSSQPPAESPPPIGRIDGWTIASGSVAIAGLGASGVFGILALASRPSSGFVTGRDGTYQDLKSKADGAHTLAVVADVALITGAVFTGFTAYLFFGRKQDPKRRATPAIGVTDRGLSIGIGGSF